MKVVIAGGSVAAFESALKFRKTFPEAEIVLLTEEKVYPYRRPGLPSFIAQMTDDPSKLWIRPSDFYAENHLDIRFECKVTAVCPSKKQVVVNDSETVSYDRLVLATGGRAWIPPIPGAEMYPPMVLRTLDDAMCIRQKIADGAASAVVIGGGVLGVELAEALEKRGLSVSIIETADRLRCRDFTEEQSAQLLEKITASGKIRVFTSAKIIRIEAGAVILDGVDPLSGDMILCTAGSRPDLAYLENSGVEIRKAVVVSPAMHTNIPGVYACGDAAELDGNVCGLFITARKMALALETL